MTGLDEQQQSTAEKLVSESLESLSATSAVINLAGAVGSGKTTVLRLAEELFRQHGVEPIFLSAPFADAETSVTVLADAADSVTMAGILNGEAEILRDPNCRWLDKFRAITGVIDRERDKFVILCDEPFHWFRQGVSEVEGTTDFHARLVSDWIFKEAKCRRIVSGRVVATGLPRLKQFRVPRVDNGKAFLEGNAFWGSAADLASAISKLTKKSIEDRSVMEVRLLVAWAWLFDAKSAAKQCVREFSAKSLLENFLDRLEESARNNSRHRAVCRAMSQLAVGRVDLPAWVSSDLLGELSTLEADVVKGCFCEQLRQSISLHPLVAHEVNSRMRGRKREDVTEIWRLAPPDRSRVHNLLYDLANSTPPGESFRADLEALHHGVLCQQIQDFVSHSRLHFVEQLHEIGRSLSYIFRQHQKAAEVFRMALTFNEECAYSHHYLAFNLDWNAESPAEVEWHYQRAIALQPEHPWWWSRWISYLATRGRFKAAGKQWRDALDALSVTEDSTPDWIYFSLHRWVARWMLHWSNLDLAENVLRSIPSSLQSFAGITRLNELLTALRFAERGQAVFPLSVPANEWWSPRPHTNLPIELDGLRLSRWYPARVQCAENNGNFVVLYAKPPVCPGDDALFDEIKLSREEVQAAAFQFNCQCLHEGSFIEIGFYGEGDELKIGLHADGPLEDPDLIPLVPPPDRWYRRAVKAAWSDVGESH
jgi:hypothetical protein